MDCLRTVCGVLALSRDILAFMMDLRAKPNVFLADKLLIIDDKNEGLAVLLVAVVVVAAATVESVLGVFGLFMAAFFLVDINKPVFLACSRAAARRVRTIGLAVDCMLFVNTIG